MPSESSWIWEDKIFLAALVAPLKVFNCFKFHFLYCTQLLEMHRSGPLLAHDCFTITVTPYMISVYCPVCVATVSQTTFFFSLVEAVYEVMAP